MSRAAVKENPLGLSAPGAACPACGSADLEPVIRFENVPTNSCLILTSEAEAKAFPRGDIEIVFCPACGFMHNCAFDARLTEYSGRYEATQAYSAEFNRWQADVARRLGEKFGLTRKSLVEIGCGHGEFCHLLAAIGENRVVGFDPAAEEVRTTPLMSGLGEVRLVADYFGPATTKGLEADCILSKMTLEHVPDVNSFIGLIVDAASRSKPGMGLYLQVPESERILDTHAFWDIYYEHCNYFTRPALGALLARSGFAVREMALEYSDQYLAAYADFAGSPQPVGPYASALPAIGEKVSAFRSAVTQTIDHWRRFVSSRALSGKSVVSWGSGSKGVSFLGVLEDADQVAAVVDINPHRQGGFMVGSGRPIIGPDELVDISPDTVIVMNPVYVPEISAMLRERMIACEVVALD